MVAGEGWGGGPSAAPHHRHKRIDPNRERPRCGTCRCPSWLQSLSYAENRFGLHAHIGSCVLATALGRFDSAAPVFPVSSRKNRLSGLAQRKHPCRLTPVAVPHVTVPLRSHARFHVAESPSETCAIASPRGKAADRRGSPPASGARKAITSCLYL